MFAKGVVLFYLSEGPISYTAIHCSTTVKNTLLTLTWLPPFWPSVTGEVVDSVLWREHRNLLAIPLLLIRASYRFQGDVYVKKKVRLDRGAPPPTSP